MHRGLRASAETAAGQHRLELHVLWFQTQYACNRLMLHRLELTAEARYRTRAVPTQVAVERLHGRVREIGKHKLRFDHPISTRECGFGVTMRACNRAGLARQRAILLDQLLAAALLGGRLVPNDLELLAALEGRPRALGIDGDARRDLLDFDHAGNCERFGRIKTCNLATEPGRTRHHYCQHTRLADIDGELRRAVRLG